MSSSVSATNSVLNQIPEAYEKVPEGLGFTDRLQPFYRRVIGDDISFDFCSGALYDSEQLLLRCSGTYYLMSPKASDQAAGRENSGLQQRLASLMGKVS
ncbi:MAG: hypothetical protein AAF098_08140 [Pseudomonadota bacterium]